MSGLSDEDIARLLYTARPELPLPPSELVREPVHAHGPPPTKEWKSPSVPLSLARLPSKCPKLPTHDAVLAFTAQKNYLASFWQQRRPSSSSSSTGTTNAAESSSSSIRDRYEMDRCSNKVLELVGDAALRSAMTLEVSRRFPGLSAGAVATLTEPMLTNATLSYIGWAYAGFSSSIASTILLPTSSSGSGPTSSTPNPSSPFVVQGALADTVEAYVGSLVHSSPKGFHRLRKWIRRMVAEGGVFGEGLEERAKRQLRYDLVKFGSGKDERKRVREYDRSSAASGIDPPLADGRRPKKRKESRYQAST